MANGNGTQTPTTITPDQSAGFDVAAARQAGYSDAEILAHLTQTRNFDVAGAQKAGYSKAEIIDHLSSKPVTIDWSKYEGASEAPQIDFSKYVTIAPGAPKNPKMNRYFQTGQGTQEFPAGSTDEQQFLQRFPQARTLAGWCTG